MPKASQRIISLDTESTGLDLAHGARPFFVTICDQDGEVQYWEADVDPLTRQPQWNSDDLMEIESLIEDADQLVLQNPKFDVRGLWTIGIDGEWPWEKTVDTLMAGHLLVSNQPHDLTTMAMIYLRVNIQPLEDALEVATKEAQKIAKREFPEWQLANKNRPDMPSAKEKTWKYDSFLPRAIAKAKNYPPDHDWWDVLANYGNGDSSVTLPLFLKQEQLLVKAGLWKIYKERLKLLPVIYQMESNGMTMSRSRLEELYGRLTTEAEQCRQECIQLADGEIEDLPVNGMSNALRYVLFEKFALKSNKKTPKGAPSGDKFVLDHWLATLPEQSSQWQFVNNLRRYRKRKTAIGYMDSYQKFWLVDPKYDPREHHLNQLREWYIVYPSYNSTGTDTLRFSSQNPNAQQVSKQEEVNTRYCFGPAPGREWWSCDAQNIELRLPAYMSGEQDLIDLFEHPDDAPYYGSTHLLNFHTVYPEIWEKELTEVGFDKVGPHCKKKYASTWYQWCKNGGFAVQYGAVEKSGSMGTADRAFHRAGSHAKLKRRFSKLESLNKRCIEFAESHGYIETIPDRSVDPSRGYPLYCSRTEYNRVLATVPLNYYIQGSAMWWMMKAMIRCSSFLSKYSTDYKIVCQVHDELIFDFPVGGGLKKLKCGSTVIDKCRSLMALGGDDYGIPTPVSCSYHPTSWAEEVDV